MSGSSSKRTSGEASSGQSKKLKGTTGSLASSPHVPGSIMKIELENFMCHEYFEVELAPSVTFIVGRNGSGKSAILMGLLIGLGGKSAATNRGSNITEFIKQGSSYGKVTVTICNSNESKSAWNYKMYGDTVTVERRISKKQSAYKLKSHEGRVISTAYNQLNLLLNHFNIQVTNPVSILNQEMSKRFLATKDPSDKYKFFLQSTHLEKMISDYQQVNTELALLGHTIRRKEQSLPDMRAQFISCKSKYDEANQLQGMRDKIGSLKDELIWSKVKKLEETALPIEMSIEKLKRVLPAKERELTTKNSETRAVDASIKKLEKEIEVGNNKYGNLQSESESRKCHLHAKKKEAIQTKKEIATYKATMKDLEQDKRQLEEKIRTMEENNKRRNLEEERAQREVELAECREKIASLSREMQEVTGKISTLETHRLKLTEESTQIRDDLEQNQSRDAKLMSQINTCKGGERGRVQVFGAYMEQLIAKVERAYQNGEFHQKPRGPFGMHIKVRDSRWTAVVEGALRGFLHNWVIHDSHDKAVFTRIYRSCVERGDRGSLPNITMMKFRDGYYDISRNRAQAGNHTTMHDMLEIGDNMISNALVELASIEQVLLIENSEEARQLIVGHAPPNVSSAWTLSGDDVKARGVYTNDLSKQTAKILCADSSDLLRQLEGMRVGCARDREELRRKKGDVEGRLATVRSQVTSMRGRQSSLKRELGILNERSIELDNLEDAPMMDATALQQDVVSLDDQLAELVTKRSTSEVKLVALSGEVAEARRLWEESTQNDSTITSELEELRNRMGSFQRKRNKLTQEADRLKENKKKITDQIVQFEKDLEQCKKDIEEGTEQAKLRCPERIVTDRYPAAIETLLKKMQIQMNRSSVTQEEIDELAQSLQLITSKYKYTKKELSDLKQLSKKLQSDLSTREKHYFVMRKNISIRLSMFFSLNLSQRGYTGKIEIDHQAGSLNMQLHMPNRKTHDVKSLSGGERSFSTVCFICSLWSLMESPFRCLDEFDVFMDLYNRRITMKMLIDYSKRADVRPSQYILLTPQNLSSVPEKDKVGMKILQLDAPSRFED